MLYSIKDFIGSISSKSTTGFVIRSVSRDIINHAEKIKAEKAKAVAKTEDINQAVMESEVHVVKEEEKSAVEPAIIATEVAPVETTKKTTPKKTTTKKTTSS